MSANVDEVWAVLWHPMGSFRIQMLRDHVALCRQKCVEGGGLGSLVVGLAGSMEEAMEMEKALKAEVKMRRKQGEPT